MRTRRSAYADENHEQSDSKTICKRIKVEKISGAPDDCVPLSEIETFADGISWSEANKENIPPLAIQNELNFKETDCGQANIASNADSNSSEVHIELPPDENGIVDESLLHLANLIAAADPNVLENWDSSAQYAITYDEKGQLSFEKEPIPHVGTPYPARGQCTVSRDTPTTSDTQALTPNPQALFDSSFDSEQPTVIYAATSTPMSTRYSSIPSDTPKTSNGTRRKQVMAYGDVNVSKENNKAYNPSVHSRNSHNEKERRRRSRMKYSCQMLRKLVPGVGEKTDKATVLEHAVHYLLHLHRCPTVNCEDYVPKVPPPVITKLQYVQTAKYMTSNEQSVAVQSSSADKQDNSDNQLSTIHYPSTNDKDSSDDDDDSDEDYVNMG